MIAPSVGARARRLASLATLALTLIGAPVRVRAQDAPPLLPSETATTSAKGTLAAPSWAQSPARLSPPLRSQYTVDPITDTSIIILSGGTGGLLELILQTGELRPQSPGNPDKLLPIDRRVAMSDAHEGSAKILGDLGVGVAIAYALGDIARAAIQVDRPRDEWMRYGVMYLESATVTWAINNLVKIAVRRPRPFAYEEARKTGQLSESTNAALSFYSLHTSLVSTLATTATYLAFVRDPHSIEPWITAIAGVGVTTFVGAQRVRGHQHFPTDVIAGAMAGAGIGLLIPHLHRLATGAGALQLSPTVSTDGAGVALSGAF